MKIAQKEDFQPITFTLETREEAMALWDIVNNYSSIKAHMHGSELARIISNWFSSEAHL